MALEESVSENDEIIEECGIRLLVSEKDLAYLNHGKVDYIKNVFGEGQFVVLRV